ncbi:penicillin-insensitive murein endopeptidase [Polyangium sp. y55x31]|uniref:penicillin-insensitive murein endopeptidase n=1 Tax=Polyangium sp. y55x31 TaxID=3042688 RepID=UPI002482F323|nr:penicillin-insensitive murein endopeptidase [Polyangium sp. y55x31]MDI1479648.1 penicillin-insensitive murein endopeptidase [Polyangium sp. y55x31]
MRSVPPRALGSAIVIVAAASIAIGAAQRGARSSTNEGASAAPVTSALRIGSLPGVASVLAPAPSDAPAAASPPEAPPVPARCAPEPAIEVRVVEPPPATELFRLAKEKPEALGSASVGSPTRGLLFGGVELKDSEGILRAGGYGWGTELVIRSIERAVREVRRCFPDSPRLYVGDIARERGGWLKPHRSHQSGLDADIGYYYKSQATWYQRATAQNLDAARTWALVRALIEGGNVEMIFIDVSIQRLLHAHVATLPEGERPPEDVFPTPTKRDTIIRHAWGHATHFHVRFRDPAAVALGQRLADILPRLRGARRAPR